MFWKLQEDILEEKDIASLVDFIKTTKRFTQFEKVKEFEEAWSKWQGCKYSVFVNSGSSANLIIVNLMKGLYGWRSEDEVLVPTVTWVTNVSPAMQLGLKPVFVDVNLQDFSFDYDELARKITPRTKAIFVTHLIGFPADVARIKNIIGGRDIKIFEDCCESHGAMLNGKKIGNLGLVSSFSFYWGHHMTSVEGGMVCTDNRKIFEQAVLNRSHGLARELPSSYHQAYKAEYPDIDFNFLFVTDGFNFRNTEFNAVLALSQLKRLDSYIEIRRRNYEQFLKILNPYSDQLLMPHKEGISPFCLPFLLYRTEMKQALQKKLVEAGIESRPIISGNLLRQPFLRRFGDFRAFKNADFIHTNGFYIGNNQFVNEERLNRLAELLREFFRA